MTDESVTATAAPEVTRDDIAEARSRVNHVVWSTFIVATALVASLWVRHGRWHDYLVVVAVIYLVYVQHDAIKAARALGHGRRVRHGGTDV